MKIIIGLLLALIAPVYAQEQQNKTNRVVYCFNINDIWNAAKTLDQNIVWVGKDEENTRYALLVSNKTKNFSIIHFNDTKGCVLGGGTDFRYGNSFEGAKK